MNSSQVALEVSSEFFLTNLQKPGLFLSLAYAFCIRIHICKKYLMGNERKISRFLNLINLFNIILFNKSYYSLQFIEYFKHIFAT